MKETVVQVGEPVLRQKAKPVAKKDFGTRKLTALLKKMAAALAPEEHGVALAAPQVGSSLRIFIVAGKVFAAAEDGGPVAGEPRARVFINPEFLRISKKKTPMSEGCLSVRGMYGMVKRSEKASLKAFDENGKPFTYHASGLLAQIFQHEMDHLDGILFTDKAEHLDAQEKE